MQNRIVRKILIFWFIMLFLGANVSNGFFVKNYNTDSSKFNNLVIEKSSYPPEEEWNRTFGGITHDSAYSILQTPDGGFVILGYTQSFGNGGDVWLIKTDSGGYEEWNKTFDGIGYYDGGYDILRTSDDGYIIPGFITNMAGPPNDFLIDAWLIKLDSNFNEQWNRTYGGDDYESFTSIQQLDDGYIILGSISKESGVNDMWLLKTDKYGTEQWNKTYGINRSGHGESMISTSDGGFIIIGVKQKNIEPYDIDFWLLKIDENGNMLWNKTFGGSNWDWGYSVLETNDSGYFLVGRSGPFQESDDLWLIKTDSNGNELWNKTFGGEDDDSGESIIQSMDGNYILIGYTDSFGVGGSDGWLIKIDSNGNELWNITFGGTDDDRGQSIIQSMDDEYIIAGITHSFGAGFNDAWLIKYSYGISPKKVYVDDDFDENTTGWGYTHFDKIQDGIDAVNENGTIIVYTGRYFEHITINKSVKLIGENNNNTIIDGNGDGEPIFILPNVDYVNICGFTLINGDFAGIDVRSSLNFISNNRILNNCHGGIVLYDFSQNNTISNNFISSNNISGITLLNECKNNNIINNTITGHNSSGIYLSFDSNNNTIIDNKINSNKYNGILLINSRDNIITFNKINLNNQSGIRFYSGNNNKIIGNDIFNNKEDGILLHWGSNDNYIEGNNISLNLNCGINFSHSENSSISNNTIVSNYYGIISDSSFNITITFNKISENWFGVYLYRSYLNNIISNTIKDNHFGIEINDYSERVNKIIKNNFLGNKRHAFFINGKNEWKNNYWERARLLPKPIFGKREILFRFYIPWINFDWHPAKVPYEI